MFFHDGWSATEVAKKVCPGDSAALEAAILHVQLDEQCSRDEVFHNQLKMWAEMDARQRKCKRESSGNKQGKGQVPASLEQIEEDIKRMEKDIKRMLEIQRLARLMSS